MRKRNDSGFSMFELLIVMAFMAIMGSIGIGYYFNFQRQAILSSTIEEVNAFVYATQQKSIGQQELSQWGVHFENPTGSGKPFYASFKGASYVTPVETRYLDGALDFVYPADGTSVDVIFSKITGKVSDGAYKKVYILLNPGTAMKAVNISPLGVITINDGEVGWWKMDEGSGTTTGDSSGYGKMGTINGSVFAIDNHNQSGKALYFDGVDDYVNVGVLGNITNGSMSFNAWLYRSESGVRDIPFGNYSGANSVNFEITASNFSRVYWNSGQRDLYGTFPVPSNQWVMYTFVRDVSTDKFYSYIDGVLKDTLSGAGTNIVSTANHYIGRDIRTGTTAFKGSIDDVRLYDHALSSDEVKHLYETTK